MPSSPSSIVADFAEDFVAAADSGAVEENAQVLDSKSQRIETDKGIVVSNAKWDFSPTSENVEKFFDALLIVGFFWRINTTDPTERRLGRDKCFELSQKFTEAIHADQTLGDRVCDVQILQLVDGENSSTSDNYAIINLPIILNPTGARDFNLGEAR